MPSICQGTWDCQICPKAVSNAITHVIYQRGFHKPGQAHRPAAGAGGHHHYQRLRQAVPGRGPGAGAVMEEQILAFVELMGGRGNEELLRPLCQAAEREMAGRLREGLSPEACGPAFPVAAAWLVLAGLEAGTDGVTSFSARCV